MKDYSALFLFCGLGGGALGFQRAAARIFGHEARFRLLGGIDIDPAACDDFRYLTKSPALCADIGKMQPAELRAFAGDTPPDVIFGSAPCKSFSGLTDPDLAASPEYVAMAELYVTGAELALSTWDIGPRLYIAENVPRIQSKGAELIARVRALFDGAGYVTEISSHDCGELGGLAQHRRRALLVARQKKRVPALLYQPPKRRVRAAREVLGELPLPETPSAGPMHRMPRIGWLTWVRLALIPAGGDHRDIPGALEKLQKRREAWGRHHVNDWHAPSSVIAGDGSNGACAVADPRVDAEGRRNGDFTITGWDEATGTVIGHPSAGERLAVADPRVTLKRGEDARGWTNICGVTGWNEPAPCIASGTRPAGGGLSVADPRVGFSTCGVRGWDETAATITGQAHPTRGPFSVADPRVVPQAGNPDAHWNKHRVSGWTAPAGTVTTEGVRPGSGAPSVADPRVAPWTNRCDVGTLGVVPWQDPTGAVKAQARPSTGPFSVADPRLVEQAPADQYRGTLGIVRWDDPTGVITGGGRPNKGRFAVADPRVTVNRSDGRNPDHCYYVLPWAQPSFTVHGQANPGTGAYSVADPRVTKGVEPLGCKPRAGAFGVLSWLEAAKTITAQGSIDNGPFAIADVRVPEVQPLAFIGNPKRSPFILIEEPSATPRSKPRLRRVDVPIVIIAEDGTWHRPMTPLELARLQDLPATVDGQPLKLAGENVGAWVERIGNAVPVGTAQAIAEQMLLTLLSADVGGGLALSGGMVWVVPEVAPMGAEA